MKRKIYTVVLIVLLSICFTVPVYAVSSQDDGRYLQGVSADTSVGVLISDFDLGYNEVGVYINDVQKGNMDVVATGDTVKVVSNGETSQGIVGVLGDIDGDGNIDDNDKQALKSSILKNTTLSGVYKTAADLNDNDNITGSDYAMLRLHQLGKKQIDNSAELIFSPGFRNFYIAFNLNYPYANQNISPQTISEGNVISKPSDPTRSEYDFDGWYTDEFLTYKFDFTTKPDRDMVLYAKWTTDDPDLQLLDYAYNMCRITYDEVDNANSITKNITLPTGIDVDFDNTDDVEVTWTSDNDQILSDDGTVTRPSVSTEVKLTAELSSNSKTITREFDLNVIRKLNIDVSTIQDHSTDESLAPFNNNITPIVERDEHDNVTRLDGVFSDITVECGEDALVALNSVKSLLGISNPQDEFVLVKTNNITDTKSFILQQIYNGIEVYGRTVTILTDRNGSPSYINSNYLQNINISISPQITEQQAIDEVESLLESKANCENNGYLIYSLYEYETNPRLVYKIRAFVENEESNSDYNIFVDAITSDIVFVESNNTELDNHEEGKANTFFNTYYDVTQFYYELDSDNNKTYYTALNAPYFTIGVYNDSSDNLFAVDKLFTSDNLEQWNNRVAVSAYANMVDAIILYIQKDKNCSINSYIGNRNIIVKISDKKLDNAYYNTTDDYFAFFQPKNSPYSNGAALDVVIHELTHALTSSVVGRLNYMNESGAINEAYSDILACLLTEDWTYGELVEGNSIGSRDISNPDNTNNPSFYQGTNWEGPINVVEYILGNGYANGGVHKNSTVLSHAIYRMNNNEDGTSLSYSSLIELILKSQQYGYASDCVFTDFRENVFKAAIDLGFSNNELNIIQNAFNDVGIESTDYISKIDNYGDEQSEASKTIDFNILELNNRGSRVVSKDAKVIVKQDAQIKDEQTTDEFGNVQINVENDKEYTIIIEKQGFESIKSQINADGDARHKYAFVLKPETDDEQEENPNTGIYSTIKDSGTKVYEILVPTREYNIDLDGDGTNEKFSFDIFGTDEYTQDTLALSNTAYEYMKNKDIDDIFTNWQEFFENTPRDLFYTNNIVLSELNNGERISIEGAQYEPYMLLSDIDSTDDYFDIILSGFIHDSNPGSYILRYHNGIFKNLGWVNGYPDGNLTVDGSSIVTVIEYYESQSDDPPQQVKYKVLDNKLVEIERKLYEEQGRIIQATGTVVHTTLTNDISFYFDLNEDGTDEKVEIYDNSSGELTVTVNDSLSYSTPASNLQGDILICDIDNNVPGLQIVISDQGPSADYSALFLEYDGISLNNMCYGDNYEKTGIRDNPYNTLKIDGSGTMTGTERTWVPYTWEREVEYKVLNNKIVEVEKEHYEMNVQGTMLTELDLYESPTSNTVVKTLSVGEKITLLYGDAKNWIYIEGANGDRGYCKMVDDKINGEYCSDVFYGLPMYD